MRTSIDVLLLKRRCDFNERRDATSAVTVGRLGAHDHIPEEDRVPWSSLTMSVKETDRT